MKLLVPVVAIVALLAVCAGAAAPARATDPPAAIARQILGHAPTGLAKVVVERGFLRVATDANYPPFSSIDPSTGRPLGFDVDYAKAVAKLLGLTVRFKYPAWGWVPRGLVSADHFEVSVGGLKNTWKNRRTLALTRAYYHLAAKILIRKGGPAVTGVESLAGRRVGATSGTYLRFLEDKTESRAIQFGSWDDCERALRRREIAMWLTSAVFGGWIAQHDSKFEVTGPALFWDRCAVATRKGEDDLIALMDHAVRTLKEDGTTKALIEKWFGTEDPGIRP